MSAIIAAGRPREFLRKCIDREITLVLSPPILSVAEFLTVAPHG